jgi:eukaryotic-like serine/threonine-protein kinase
VLVAGSSDDSREASDPRKERAALVTASNAIQLSSGSLIAGRYKLDQWLGEGGMGQVWAATHAITRRRVALKFLKASPIGRAEMHQRFLREARAVSLVRHPSVVDVLDVFELVGGAPVIVMDLLVGETLGAKLGRDGPLGVGQMTPLLLPVIEAVEAAHAHGIVHRDLKPDNIFLEARAGGRTQVKVLDFGIAKLTAQEGDAADTGAITGTGAVLGTPGYMAPEQLEGLADIDYRADVWALGAILYECLSGQRPVEGSNVGQLVVRMLREGITPLEQRVPELPPLLAHLVDRMLARERNERLCDLSEIRQTLARVAGAAALAPPDGLAPAELASAANGEQALEFALGETQKQPPTPLDTGVPYAIPGRRVSRSFGGAVALVALAAAGVVAWDLLHSPHAVSHSGAEGAAAPVQPSPDVLGTPEAVQPQQSGATNTVASVGTAAPPAPQRESASSTLPIPVAHTRAAASPLQSAVSALRSAPMAPEVATAAARVPAAAAGSAEPARSPRKADGGLFEGLPF